jgi:hypothetical protein
MVTPTTNTLDPTLPSAAAVALAILPFRTEKEVTMAADEMARAETLPQLAKTR